MFGRGTESQEITKYRLIIEDTLIKWRNKYGDGKEVSLTLDPERLTSKVTLSMEAPSMNLLEKGDEDEFSITHRVITKLESEIKYRYKRFSSRNILTAVFCNNSNAYIFRALAIIILPIALQSLLTYIVYASEALMLGVLNQESLSSVSLAAQITFVFICMIGALSSGTTKHLSS